MSVSPYVELYAKHVDLGLRTIDSVPSKLREQVAKRVEELKGGDE